MTLRLLALLALPLLLPAAVTDNPDVAAAIRLFDAWMSQQMIDKQLPGVAVGIIYDQQLVWSKGYGFANLAAKTPVTAATRFRMASHSKLFTATAIMQLREQGKLRLDDPITKYLPWFSIKPAQPGDPTITIEELLTHASGLPREAGPHWSDLKFPDANEVKQYLATATAPYSPETRWKYSNLALTLAGMIVESVSGERYADYIQNKIFSPLGMSSSSFDKPDPLLATGYSRKQADGTRKPFPFVDAKAMGAATGLTSNIEDMARFVSSQFGTGKTILNAGSLREMHRVRRLENDWLSGNAIGFSVSRRNNKTYIGHGGGYPGYLTQTLLQLDPKIGVIVLTNSHESTPSTINARAMDTIGEAVAKATAQPAKKISWDPTWSRFAGQYESDFALVQVVELNQQLILIDPSADTIPTDRLLVPLGNGLFRLDVPSGGSAVGETVRFLEVNGKPTCMYTGDSYSVRK